MSHTYAKNAVHIVFSTKSRVKCIPRELQSDLWAYMAGICREIDVRVYLIGGAEDHVHLLIQVPPAVPLAKAVATIKANSSHWARQKKKGFAWQEGYGAFSVSASNIPAVERYIQNQAEHHKRMDFQAEFLALLKRHGIEPDSRYMFG
ncbi:MAG TPA: IS200/IS605 family transposase [Terriglobales bacterium]|nr:IS200/IS605 family transposase [Terriglobales bacterium]